MNSGPLSDRYLTAAAAQIKAARVELTAANEAAGALSPAEVALIPEANARAVWKPKGLPVAEIDCELRIPGQGGIEITLAVWGKFLAAHKGGHEPGERAYEPDDPEGFEVSAVYIGETDVTGDLGPEGEFAVASYCMENCE